MSPSTTRELALATQLFQAGRHVAAAAALRQILARDARVSKAYELLAYLAGNQGRLAECESLLRQAQALPGCSAEACFYLGRVLLQQGRAAEALAPLARSMELGGEFFEAWHELGVSHSALGEEQKALDCFLRAERLQPRSHELQTNLASCLAALRRHEEALRHGQAAIAIEPRWAPAWTGLGQTLSELHRLPEALQSFDRALAFAPGDAIACKGKAIALTRAGRHAEALAAYRALARVAPGTDYLPGQLLLGSMRLCDWSDWRQRLDAVLQAVDAGQRAAAPFALLATPASPAQLLRAATVFSLDLCPPVPASAWTATMPPAILGPRLRIAYFSADFGDHPTSQLIAGLLEQHDRQRFEVFAFSLARRPETAMRQRIRAAVDHFVEVADRSDAEAAALAREHGIAIAIDLMGFTEGCRPRIFAQRAAPLQLSYMGFACTMGSGFMDYLVADATLVTEQDRVHYSEKILTLPDSYQANDDRKPIAAASSSRADWGLPEQGFVFACFNGLVKITPDLLDSWVRVLRQVPGSVLWLLAGPQPACRALEAEAVSRGLEAGRIVWAEALPLDRHLARHAHADLFLDTFHFNAHTTCSDALWAGLAVLTVPGASFASRVAASLLKAAGLPEMVVDSVKAYEQKAVALARAPEEIRALRERLEAGRRTMPLFDTRRFARRLESAFEAVWARQLQGLAPDHIDLADT
ncbi:tetratricopeptide repeat protein [Xylophilus rhododendri]|uniref:protein O-GlcNAc transferase n=1 Tax=Xylophilus rhododendri TaxID=2697032 RepID=A0A857J8A1_9BURK|nr:tetratricopeptide repeat protein [Xylophilus rhododendri]QHI99947.1 tetratricopeptide repeat protein [Xylophilus rhododendri]